MLGHTKWSGEKGRGMGYPYRGLKPALQPKPKATHTMDVDCCWTLQSHGGGDLILTPTPIQNCWSSQWTPKQTSQWKPKQTIKKDCSQTWKGTSWTSILHILHVVGKWVEDSWQKRLTTLIQMNSKISQPRDQIWSDLEEVEKTFVEETWRDKHVFLSPFIPLHSFVLGALVYKTEKDPPKL